METFRDLWSPVITCGDSEFLGDLGKSVETLETFRDMLKPLETFGDHFDFADLVKQIVRITLQGLYLCKIFSNRKYD